MWSHGHHDAHSFARQNERTASPRRSLKSPFKALKLQIWHVVRLQRLLGSLSSDDEKVGHRRLLDAVYTPELGGMAPF